MTKPPSGGSASAPGKSEFGATTISGSPATELDPSTERVAAGAERDGQKTTEGPRTAPAAATPEAAGRAAAGAGGGDRGSAATTIQGVRSVASGRGPRRARLQVRHIDPLTVLKFSCVLAIALFFVWLIVIGVLYGVLDAAGILKHVNDTVVTINGAGSKAPITAGIVFGGAAIVGVVNIVLFIALATIGAVIYNLCADLVGGIEVTLSER